MKITKKISWTVSPHLLSRYDNAIVKIKPLHPQLSFFQGLDFYEGIPANSMLSQASLVVNGFLMANKLPSYSARKPVESVTKIAVKAWKLYSPAKDSVDIAPVLQAVTEAVSGAWQAQSRGNSFASLSSKVELYFCFPLSDKNHDTQIMET